VFDIIHPHRRNLTAIRGYVRIGGLPDNPQTDPQDRSWFGPHDRLFTDDESIPIEFVPGPEYGTPTERSSLLYLLIFFLRQCGVGGGMVQVICQDPMLILYGRGCRTSR
jgi:hypothetical protein